MLQPSSLSPRSVSFGTGALVGLVLAVVVWAIYSWSVLPRPDGSTYQAVFLTNGQVYFGKLSGESTRTPKLEDVFYLQANQALQQGQPSEARAATGTPGTAPSPQFSLAKLGKAEIHGPQDRLFLNKQQVLFWEDLRSDSQVVKTIAEYKKQNP